MIYSIWQDGLNMTATAASLREARRKAWETANAYGTTANSITVQGSRGRVVFWLRRSAEGDGTSWYEAERGK